MNQANQRPTGRGGCKVKNCTFVNLPKQLARRRRQSVLYLRLAARRRINIDRGATSAQTLSHRPMPATAAATSPTMISHQGGPRRVFTNK